MLLPKKVELDRKKRNSFLEKFKEWNGTKQKKYENKRKKCRQHKEKLVYHNIRLSIEESFLLRRN